MEGDSFLNNNEQTVLEEFHRACLDKKTADRIKTILLINKGFAYKQIEEILLLDERTINRHKNLYKNEGIDGLIANNYQGARYKLSAEQIDILKRELNENIYANSEAICDFISLGGLASRLPSPRREFVPVLRVACQYESGEIW
jgi:hypothetical protein